MTPTIARSSIVSSVLGVLLWTGLSLGQTSKPTIQSLANGASNAASALPSSGIAQGSMFVVKGTNLGPAAIQVATAFPLSTTFAGTSVKVTVGGVTRDAIMYYSSAGQLAAVLPSTTPVGQGTITVSYGGLTSDPFPIAVVRSSLGVFTVNTSGGGDAIATLGNALVGPLNAPNPGDIVAFWATGLGPVNFDETGAAQQFDMTSVPVEAWVAGKPAEVLFRGRNACCTSVDGIYIRIPSGVGGCMTPVTFRIGQLVSNTTSIPTALSGRVCTPSLPTITTEDVQRTTALTQSVGVIGLYRGHSIVGAELAAFSFDGATSVFRRTRLLPGGLGATQWDIPHFGSCMVYTGGQFAGAWLEAAILRAGAPIRISGPAGVRDIAPETGAFLDFAGFFVRPGTFTVTAPAGADVGSFLGSTTLREPFLSWTNQSALSTVNRNAGVTLNWTGGDPNGYVHISGYATSATTPAVGANFLCTARTSDGQFTIPAYITQSLPDSTPSIGAVAPATFVSSIWITPVSPLGRFSASGLDWGLVSQWTNHARALSFVSTQ